MASSLHICFSSTGTLFSDMTILTRPVRYAAQGSLVTTRKRGTVLKSWTAPTHAGEAGYSCANYDKVARCLRQLPSPSNIRTHTATSSMISRLREIGFSQKIALPALAAATIWPACWSVGEQITTASTSGSLISYYRAGKTKRKDEGTSRRKQTRVCDGTCHLLPLPQNHQGIQ